MGNNCTAFQHRHPNGAMFPVQSRIIAKDKKQFDASPANGLVELHCVQCKVTADPKKPSPDFVPAGSLARIYPHYEEGAVTRIIPKANGVWYGWLDFNGRSIYFAGAYGRKFIRRPGKLPIMATWTQQKDWPKLEAPAEGTRLLFEIKAQDNEIKVNGWGLADEYDLLVSEYEEDLESAEPMLPLTYASSLPIPQSSKAKMVYRIREQTFYEIDESFTEPVTIWIGTDRELAEINEACPLSHLAKVELEGTYKKITWFEKFENEKWVDCEDPRYTSGVAHLSPPP